MDSPLRAPGFVGLLVYRLLAMLSYQIVAVTVGWHIYEITRDAWALGLIGLAEVIPYFCFALFAGYAVDHLPRRKLGMFACIGLLGTTLLLAGVASGHVPAYGTVTIYVAIALNGVVRAFRSPVCVALFAGLLKRDQFARGAGIGSVVMQTGFVLGPAMGGLLIAGGGKTIAYLVAAGFAAAAAVAVVALHRPPTWCVRVGACGALAVVPSVIFGGCMTLAVVGVTAWKAPRLRRLDLRDLH